MKTLGVFWILSWLLRSTAGQLAVLIVVLWYLDNRYFGLLAALWAPIARAQRISGLRHAVEINPSDVRAMVELGEHYLRSGRYQTAAQYLERAMDRGEDAARALFALGAAEVKLGRHTEGAAKLREAIAKQPNTAFGEPYLYLLESTLATEGAHAPKVEELVGALDQFDSVEILTRAGRLCSTAGRQDLARPLLEHAIHNYSYIPKAMRRRERRWLFRARFHLLQIR